MNETRVRRATNGQPRLFRPQRATRLIRANRHPRGRTRLRRACEGLWRQEDVLAGSTGAGVVAAADPPRAASAAVSGKIAFGLVVILFPPVSRL
jgi:hypothetical protein